MLLENFFAVEFTIAVAILEIIGIGAGNLLIGEYGRSTGEVGVIGGIAGIPGT